MPNFVALDLVTTALNWADRASRLHGTCPQLGANLDQTRSATARRGVGVSFERSRRSEVPHSAG